MPTSRVQTRHITTTSAAAAILLLGVTLSGCGSTDEPNGGSSTSASSPSSQPSASSADPNAGWHPAKDEGGQFLVPPDWDVEQGDTGPQLQAPPQREGGVRVGGGSLGSSPTLDSADAIDTAAEVSLKFHKSAGLENVERLPDETFGGVRFYHIRGEDSADWTDDYGTVTNGQLITILWHFHRGMVDRKQTDELLNQVMPTFEPAS
ncbi:hypothetical protein [Nocardioides sp. NPDC047086]|uniref:hypothetical protein n=1 Tax=Nocardioides sp. NPDC047086 TaxID=3154810 RepID=UPI0033D6E028